jgi:hypothetical protein
MAHYLVPERWTRINMFPQNTALRDKDEKYARDQLMATGDRIPEGALIEYSLSTKAAANTQQ